jgi:hypothetical protein
MTVGFASDAQEQLSGQVVTEEILTSEIPIPNMAIPNMQIQVPFGDLGLSVEPATYLQLINDTEGGLEIRRQAELELESLHILQDNLDLMWESEQLLEQEHAENIESAGVLPLNFNLMIDAALAGTTNPASNEAREILSNAGYQAVDSWIAT